MQAVQAGFKLQDLGSVGVQVRQREVGEGATGCWLCSGALMSGEQSGVRG